MSRDDIEKPEWWRRNEALRTEMNLPQYEPPRFSDDTYLHEVVTSLESRYNCSIHFVGVNTTHLDDWEIRLDGETVGRIGRHRTSDGNTVFELESEQFRSLVTDHLSNRD